MKILVSCVPFDNGKSGISVYIRKTVEELKNQGHDLTLILEPGCGKFFPGMKMIFQPEWTKRALFSMLYHSLILPFQIKKMQKKEHFDFCLLTAANRRALAFYPLYTISVVHDLAQYHVKAKYDPLRMIYLMYVLPFFVRKSPSVLAISRSTAQDLCEYWSVPSEKIFLNYNGLSLPEKECGGFLSEYGLESGKYILYVSRIEHPGKNHLKLIKAFEKLCRTKNISEKLVLVGSDWDGAQKIHDYARCSSFAERIVFTGFVPLEKMPEAYRNAACYVFPSFFEGFGLSLIEAMHYGTPCCASENSSLGEIGKGSALLFRPDDTDAIADAVYLVLSNPSRRADMISCGKLRAMDFSWKKHAEEIVRNYENRFGIK